MSEKNLREIIGDPHRLDAEMQKFRRNVKRLSSQQVNLLAQYPNRWVGFYAGRVRADAPTLDQLLARLDALQIPRKEAVVHYVDQSQRRMIL